MSKKPRTLKFDDIFSATKDHSSAADQPELVEAIIARLPDIQATEEQKREFACEIVSELPYVVGHAEDKYNFPILRDELLESSEVAKKTLSKFRKLLVQYRASIKGNLDAAHAMNPRITQKVDIKDVLDYLGAVQTALRSVKTRERKQRQDRQSIIGHDVAVFLREQFKLHFAQKPYSGKGRRPYGKEIIRDYDRLCFFLNDHYGIKISKSTKIDFIIPATAKS